MDNSFTDRFTRKLYVTVAVPPHLNCVTTLPCEILKSKRKAELLLIPSQFIGFT